MVNIDKVVKLPENWRQQSHEYENLLKEANKQLNNKKERNDAIFSIYELIYGILEYLEADVTSHAQTGKVVNDPRIKTYEDQILSLMTTLETISQETPELAPDRYVLYLEVFKKLLLVNLDAISAFSLFINKTVSKINVKKVPQNYLDDFIIFGTEIAILSYESKNLHLAQEILENLREHVITKFQTNVISFLYSLVGLAITYEKTANYNQASSVYFEVLSRINGLVKLRKKDEIPLQLIHETIYFGYITAFLGDKFETNENEFYSLVDLCDNNVASILRAVHSIVFFGYSVQNAFIEFGKDMRPAEIVDYYLKSSSVQSHQLNNPIGFEHVSMSAIFPIIEDKSRIKGVLEGIVIVESQNLKGIKIYSGKKLLPSLNVYPGEISNYVILDDMRFNVKNQFAFGTVFNDEIEITINYNKKNIIKKTFNIRDKIPPFFVLDLTEELHESMILSEGGIKEFDTIWSKNMSLYEALTSIRDINDDLLLFKSDKDQKEFFKDLGNLFKKINLSEEAKIINDLQKQDYTYTLKGKPLKLVIMQRLSSLDANNTEISELMTQLAQS